MNFLSVIILLHIRGEKMEEKFLIKKAKRGDKEALIELIMSQKSDYYKLAYVYMKNKDDSLDAMQDMIVILYENIGSLKKDEAFYSWSKTILVNLCKKSLKDKNKVLSIETLKEQVYEDDEGLDDRLLLEKYLSSLKPIYEEVIRLKYILDLDYASIAKLLKIPLGTVKSRINTGMKTLRVSMEGEKINE